MFACAAELATVVSNDPDSAPPSPRWPAARASFSCNFIQSTTASWRRYCASALELQSLSGCQMPRYKTTTQTNANSHVTIVRSLGSNCANQRPTTDPRNALSTLSHISGAPQPNPRMDLLVLLFRGADVDRHALLRPRSLQRFERIEPPDRDFGAELGATIVERDAAQLRARARGQAGRQVAKQ